MKVEPSKLAPLVTAYYEKFDQHVPDWALRQFDAGDLSAQLRDSLASGVPLSDAGWGWPSPAKFPCCGVLRFEIAKPAKRRKKRRDGPGTEIPTKKR
jgi:hypothetical protein